MFTGDRDGWRRAFRVVVSMVAAAGTGWAGTGCYATRSVTAAHLRPLRGHDHGGDLVLGHDSGVPLRLSPRAQVRFRRRNGTTTGWLVAGRLNVDREMIWTAAASAGPAGATRRDGVRWATLAEMEVNDLDVGRSVAGTAGAASIVMGAALVEVSLVCAIAGLTGGGGGVDELGITRAAVEVVGAHVLRRPRTDESFAWEAPPPSAPGAPTQARPLFAPSARRRALARVAGGSASGLSVGVDGAIAPVATFAAAVRLVDVVELGGGLRLMGGGQGAAVGERAPGAGERWAALPFVRLGLHADVDAARRLAVFAGVEIATTSRPAQLGLVGGLRWRPGGGALQIGIYPMNPIYTGDPASDRGAPTRRALATTVELGFLL